MKKLFALALFCTALSFTGEAQVKFGAGAQIILDGFSVGVGGRALYEINEDFAVQGGFHYYFEDFTAWTIDADVHYRGFDLGDVEGFRLSPFAGLNRFQVSVAGFGAGTTNLNLGINGTLPLSGGLELYIEPKIIIGNGGSFAIAGGVYF